ncbi:MAG: PKD domain-containing protein [Candidatus Bathyarchaeota archaeon]|nr:PKD domain-containing protein [Candidatus Bathyarchaeota archaeon]
MKAPTRLAFVFLCLSLLMLCFFPTERFVSAQGSGSITYDSGSNTISVADFSASNPATFEDLYVASQAGNWGVVSKPRSNEYTFAAHIIINADSYLNDTNTQVTMDSRVITHNADFFISGAGFLTLGTVYNAAVKMSSNGCSFYAESTIHYFNWIYMTGGSYLYSSSFNASGIDHAIVYVNTLWNAFATGLGFSGFRPASNADFYNVTCVGTYYGIYLYADKNVGKEDQVTLIGNVYGIRNWANGDGVILSNVYARNNTYLFCNQAVTTPISQYLVNIDSDNWRFSWQSNDNTVYRQYTYDITVTDDTGHSISRANLTLVDNSGRRVFSTLTNSTGQVPTQVVSRGFYNNTGGNTLYDLGPFTLTATAAGYSNYTTQLTFTRPAVSQITLVPTGLPSPSPRDSEPYTKARFTFSPSNPAVDFTVTLNGASSDSSSFIETYFWSFGDGTNATDLVTATHVYSAAGNYTVTLTVTSADGTDSWSQVITVGSDVQATVMVFPWWWIVVAVLLLLLLLLLFLLLRRRRVVVIQTRRTGNPKCSGEGKCDDCELKPC